MVEYITDDQKGKPTRCPICGETFRPAPQHIYAIGSPSARKPGCSYTCMRDWERGKVAKKQKQKRREKNDR